VTLGVKEAGRAPAKFVGSFLRYGQAMAECKRCGEDVESLVTVKVDGKSKKVCEECADVAREQSDIAEQSESVVQQMMGYKGRR
jgi:ribosome-binding protein aMBF1 (putative translation factor)